MRQFSTRCEKFSGRWLSGFVRNGKKTKTNVWEKNHSSHNEKKLDFRLNLWTKRLFRWIVNWFFDLIEENLDYLMLSSFAKSEFSFSLEVEKEPLQNGWSYRVFSNVKDRMWDKKNEKKKPIKHCRILDVGARK